MPLNFVLYRAVFNPESEIKMEKALRDFGAEMQRKNRSHTQSGLVRFFNSFMPKSLQHLVHFNFGFRVKRMG